MQLSRGDIHVWLTFLDEVRDEILLQTYRGVLCASELLQEKRFHFAADRKRYLVTRTLVREVLASYLGIDANSCEFSHDEYGRPHLKNARAESSGLVFSISHSDGLIALAVTLQRSLGIDVERLDPRRSSDAVAKHFFAPSEVAALLALPELKRVHRFFEYWTFKESYVKARGMGLSIPLDQFSFRLSGEHSVGFTTREKLAGDSTQWSFWQLRPSPEYILAICAQRWNAGHSGLIVRKIIPSRSRESLDLKFTRSSERDVETSVVD
jgi:4'-phosphopantetheinyl transferase